MSRRILAFVFALAALTSPLFADTIRFAYTFATGTSISGTVDGNLMPDQNTVSNLHNLDAIYSGDPSRPLHFLTPLFDSLTLNGVLIQFAGFGTDTSGLPHSDFGFLLVNDVPGSTCPNCASVGYFNVGTDQVSIGSSLVEGPVDYSRWQASILPAPEPADSLLTMIFIAGLVAIKRRRGIVNLR